jgi:hypothetical protein
MGKVGLGLRLEENQMSTDYQEFIASKVPRAEAFGFEPEPLPNHVFDFQAAVISWGLRRGRAAFFEDCGLGKTPQQIEWARQVARRTNKPVLILAPLAVAMQTQSEGQKFGVLVERVETADEIAQGIGGIYVTNYDKLHKFDGIDFGGVVLDESSILKAFDGKTKQLLCERFANTPYRLCCTATPAPNDYTELGNHCEFLGIMTRTEMLATFFTHDGGDTSKWRLKGHAREAFWIWVASWAVCLRKPSDIGFSDEGYELPPLEIRERVVESNLTTAGMLFAMPASSLQERREARKASIDNRVHAAAEIASKTPGQWLIWCGLNNESEAVTKLIEGAVEVTGSDSDEHKEWAIAAFLSGEIRVLVSKVSIFGYGLNMQCCHQQIFLGMSDSYEDFYQAIRRSWRFGQSEPVTAWMITSNLESAVVENVRRKEREATTMAEEMAKIMSEHMNLNAGSAANEKDVYARGYASGKGWELYLGDCVEIASELKSDSIHFSVFSPPFASLYTYSNSERDMGNCRTHSEFFTHFQYMVRELYRVTMPGRLCAFHCMNLPTSKARDGVIGLEDFRGALIRAFTDADWVYHSEVCIWKDPVTAMQRTKALGLLHKTIRKDSSMSRQGLPDYLVVMRKPGDNPERIAHTPEQFPVELWQRYASPVWATSRGEIDGFIEFETPNASNPDKGGIYPGDTLQKESAREHNDERHICPLQLPIIERAIKLWSNPGDLVFSPFAGIGSEGFVALKNGRRFIGSELKRSYFEQARLNLHAAEQSLEVVDLFTLPNAVEHETERVK